MSTILAPATQARAADIRDYDLLTLPGWHGSGEDHWQTHWEAALPYAERVGQDDWDSPHYRDWAPRLSEAVAGRGRPVILIAHSLGTSLVTRWAIETGGAGVAGALLVATTDRDRWESDPAEPQGFAPMLLAPLPFPSIVVASSDDPRCTIERSRAFADAWGSRFIDAGALGHIGSATKLGIWPQGLLWLGELVGGLR
ncbi:RBBP9/YdeN family alpha/beta hydrolase [Sphingomonas abietis]|uniref:Alpha/beta hydrolase n=1 Tax=Sphingomonas abietis TaxID=3012344 RepID=A0ABY7NIK7_9SPHN|nr:alpha/beta hydrolase [Sphingomonas abietis]WBO21355.1 alpha/beta hydrolase [Sphingomonas abietis]